MGRVEEIEEDLVSRRDVLEAFRARLRDGSSSEWLSEIMGKNGAPIGASTIRRWRRENK